MTDSAAEGTGAGFARYDLFVAHSHDDQGDAYALTHWASRAWEGLRFFLTSRDQYEIYQLIPGYYFEALRASRCVLLWATPVSLRSAATLEEVVHAVRAGREVLVACDQRSDREAILAAIRRAVHPSDVDSRIFDVTIRAQQEEFLASIATAIGRPRPDEVPSLRTQRGRIVGEAVPRGEVPEGEPRLPDVDALARCRGSREDALIWLGMIEKWSDNLMNAGGIKTYLIPREDEDSEDDRVRGRVFEMLLSADVQQLPLLACSLRPLVDVGVVLLLRQAAAFLEGADPQGANRCREVLRAILSTGDPGPVPCWPQGSARARASRADVGRSGRAT